MRIVVVILTLLLVAPLSAMTVQPLSFAQLVADSTAVVHGRVVDVRGQWTADRQGIDSLVTLEALQYFKGGIGTTVTVRVPGGRVGSLVHVLPGAPTFAAGDRVVLFLKTNGPSIPIVTGTTQGVFRVRQDPTLGTAVVVPGIVDPQMPPGRIGRGDPSRRPVSIDVFESAVRAAGDPR
jgi:hypothetical protein